MISVRNITKRFGAQTVLDNVTVEIPDGLTTAIVGPSGVGKSVLLKLIMGILQPEHGEVYIDSHNMTAAENERARNKIREDLGILFQSAALFDSLTVYDNIVFPLKQRRAVSSKVISERANELLRSLSLTRYAHRYPEELSLGIRKRVGMARALIQEPKVFLFDEPNTGLDPLDGQEVYDLITECKQKWGFTGVVISHELPEVFQVSDRVLMLLGGKVIASGTPEEFVQSSNEAVQQFLEGKTDGPIKIH